MITAQKIREKIRDAEVEAVLASIRFEFAQKDLSRHHAELKRLKHKLSKAEDIEGKRAANRDRAAAKRIAKKYSIPIEDDSIRDSEGYNLKHWVYCPDRLKDDPLGDGHYSHSWADTRWLVEFYAKHHPSHPQYGEREFIEFAPHA